MLLFWSRLRAGAGEIRQFVSKSATNWRPLPWLTECLDLLEPFTVYFIGVHCPLEELRRREQARGDRGEGLAEYQLSRVHRHGVYDLEVDTSVLSADQCAVRIKELVERDASPQALVTLRHRRETA